jgi:hypothetical protein
MFRDLTGLRVGQRDVGGVIILLEQCFLPNEDAPFGFGPGFPEGLYWDSLDFGSCTGG